MENTLRTYYNTCELKFAEHGENGNPTELPHYGKWLSVIVFLRNRGWKITENSYYKKQYNCLSKYHKIGFKNDVACLMEIGGASITIQFGHTKNLWHNMPQSFWEDPTDNRYTEFSQTSTKICCVK